MGLGTIPNSFGIVYSDWVALAHARKVDPDVVHCSPAFYQIMWNLYLEKLFTDPAEVARIYVEKARLILADPVVEPGLPLGVILLVGLCHLVVARAFDLWSKVKFPQGALLEGAALVFICFFVAQAILASPDRHTVRLPSARGLCRDEPIRGEAANLIVHAAAPACCGTNFRFAGRRARASCAHVPPLRANVAARR
jgi:hypothetical protein